MTQPPLHFSIVALSICVFVFVFFAFAPARGIAAGRFSAAAGRRKAAAGVKTFLPASKQLYATKVCAAVCEDRDAPETAEEGIALGA